MEQGEESAVEGYQYAGWLRAQVRVSCADSEPTDPSSSTTRGKRGRVDNNATTKRVTTVGEALEKSMGALRSHVGSQSSAGTERTRADGLEVELCGATGACNGVHARITEAPDVMLVDLEQSASTITGATARGVWAGAPLGPLRALALLVAKQSCAVRGVLEAVDDAQAGCAQVTARVRLHLYLPDTLWSDFHPWSNKCAPATAFVFCHLTECTSDADIQRSSEWGACGVVGCTVHPQLSAARPLAGGAGAGAPAPMQVHGQAEAEVEAAGVTASAEDPFVLCHLFRGLPSHLGSDAHVVGPELQCAESSWANATQDESMLCSLGQEALNRVLQHLPVASLVAISRTCRFMHDACRNIIPGLVLGLYPHQRAAVRWMLERERPPALLPEHPHVRCLRTASGLPFTACLATGAVATDDACHAAAAAPDVRGGLFCDDPGLGKTVTGLALVLKTLGTVASPPPDVVPIYGHSGRRFGFYKPMPAGAALVPPTPITAASSPAPGADDSSPLAEALHGGVANRNLGFGSEHAVVTNGIQRADMEEAAEAMAEADESGLVERAGTNEGENLLRDSARIGAKRKADELDASLPEASQRETPGKEESGQVRGQADEAAENWLQCDVCSKWRRLPPGLGVDLEAEWFCGMHPEPGFASCRVPCTWMEEYGAHADVHLSAADGYVPLEDDDVAEVPAELRERNKLHFLKVLRELVPSVHFGGFLGYRRDVPPALKWLCESSQRVHALLPDGPGLTVQSHHRHQANEAIFRRLGFEPAPEPKLDRKGRAAAKAKGKTKAKAKNNTWHQSGLYSRLLFDRVALQDALVQLEAEQVAQPRKSRTSTNAESPLGRPVAGLGLGSPGVSGAATPSRLGLRSPGVRTGAAAAAAVAAAAAAAASPRFAPADIVYLSAATLVVVPATLLGHWKAQVEKHVERTQDASGWRSSLLRVYVLDSTTKGKALGAQQLAWDYDLVLTTISRLSAEWTAAAERGANASLLLQVHWLRVILDEGHMLGASLGMTNRVLMACALRAERRWVMTGTPTPHTQGKDDVARLQPLLAFLHHQPYGARFAAWADAVAEPWRLRRWDGWWRLQALLRRIMIRSCKDDLRTLPPCVRSTTRLSFTRMHAESYNELVSVAQRNLLLADWWDDAHVESLLNASGVKYAREMMDNLRKSCCVAGAIDMRTNEPDIRETLGLLAKELGYPPVTSETRPYVPPEHPLWPVDAAFHGGALCGKCGEWQRLPMVTPCAHLLCLECLSQSKTHCVQCQKPYRMQSVDDPARKKTNSAPKWEVPVDLIEYQPAFAQRGAQGAKGGEWQATWEITESSKCAHLLKRLVSLGVAPAQPPPCTTAPPLPASAPPPAEVMSGGWEAGSEAAVEAATSTMAAADATTEGNGRDMKRVRWHDVVETEGVQQPRAAGGVATAELPKVIIFSDVWFHLLLVERHLVSNGVRLVKLISSMPPAQKARNLTAFSTDPAVSVLLMDSVGAVGLDLSFVSYVFLMEPIADRSLEEQVVSRAHRMGARGPVTVELLVMRDTAEEDVLRLRDGRGTGGAGGSSSVKGAAAMTEAEEELWRRNSMFLNLHRVPAVADDLTSAPTTQVYRSFPKSQQ